MNEAKSSLGILAYGSLLSDPGRELKACIVQRISVTTPFEVEYARSSSLRAGAPTLVPVQLHQGSQVYARILVLQQNITEEEACNMLYRREINSGDKSKTYNDRRQRVKTDGVVIERCKEFKQVSTVLYASLRPNIREVLDDKVPADEKVKVLASLAIKSITAGTFSSQRDGIRYLADNIRAGIKTLLTEGYQQEILNRVVGSHDLEDARIRIAKSRGIISAR